jgi:DNA-binding IclR family transcriptional regulator
MALPPKDTTGKPPPESARRVLALMLAFTKDHHTLSTRELAARTEIPLPTVYRYVAFLRDSGLLVERGAGGYSLSARVIALAEAAEAAETLIDLADPIMRRLSAEVDESVILVRLIAGAAVCVHRVEAAHHRLRTSFEPGQPLSLEGGASARLLLASLPVAERVRHLAELDSRDPQRAAWLLEAVALAGERGWAISSEEIDPGVWAGSAAVRSGDAIVASLTITSPLVRAQPREELLLGAVRAAAAEVGAALRAGRAG